MAMKYLICSDIHGSAGSAEKIIRAFDDLKCGKLIMLGDALYHGPRNPLPGTHSPPDVVTLLNSRKDKIIACRGNCDAEVDQMLLQFPITAPYCLIVDGTRQLFITHGHLWSPANPPELQAGDIFLYGHTHVQELYKNKNGVIICNPGSTSLPKGGSPAGYALYDGASLSLYSMGGEKLKTLEF